MRLQEGRLELILMVKKKVGEEVKDARKDKGL